jgi:alkylation response protein AidB-like acyl-CoA dehydrogenase
MDFELNENQRILKQAIRQFVKNECPEDKVHEWDETGSFPYELYNLMASKLGIFGLPFPEEYGGSGMGALEFVLVGEELARFSFDIGAGYGVPIFNGLTLLKFGNEKQKAFYLPEVVTHTRRLSISITEPNSGSDAASLTASARQDGDVFILNGQKTFASGADLLGNIICMYLRTAGPDSGHKGISLFLVPNDLAGLTLQRIPTLGRRILPACEIFMDDVIVSKDNLVGSLDGGWSILLDGLNLERIFSTSCYIGNTQTVLDNTLEYAKNRKQFGRAIGSFQAIGHMLSDMASQLEACRLLTYRGAWLIDQGKAATKEVSMAKVMASELYVWATNAGMQIMGGYGYCMDSSMQRYFRDARICTITAGTSQIQRTIIARQMGLKVQ